MIIESIKREKDKQDRYLVQFDDGAEIAVTAAQIADQGIYTGRELTEEDYVELIESLEISTAKKKALQILGSRMLSKREIEKRLSSKGVTAETAQTVTDWLEGIGAINDREYAKSIADYYSAKGYGTARIRDELFKRGINRDLWDDAMVEISEENDAAQPYISKKLKGSIDKEDLRRATDALCRRGFSFEEARTAVKRYVEAIEEGEVVEEGEAVEEDGYL